MEDANGAAGQLDGEVQNVDINMGLLVTQANLFIGHSSPFDLLLGQLWQCWNFVSIDKRIDRMYLLFKDKNMHVQYELVVIVENRPQEKQ